MSNFTPILLSVADAVAYSGLSRSEIYRRLADGRIKGKKDRTRTFVLTTSLDEHIAGLSDYRPVPAIHAPVR